MSDSQATKTTGQPRSFWTLHTDFRARNTPSPSRGARRRLRGSACFERRQNVLSKALSMFIIPSRKRHAWPEATVPQKNPSRRAGRPGCGGNSARPRRFAVKPLRQNIKFCSLDQPDNGIQGLASPGLVKGKHAEPHARKRSRGRSATPRARQAADKRATRDPGLNEKGPAAAGPWAVLLMSAVRPTNAEWPAPGAKPSATRYCREECPSARRASAPVRQP